MHVDARRRRRPPAPASISRRSRSRDTTTSVAAARTASASCQRVEARGDVGADDQEQVTIGGRQRAQRVDRVGRARSVDLDRADLEPVETVDRGPGHRQPVGRRRHHGAALLPGIAGDHEQHPIEAERVPGAAPRPRDARCGRDRRSRRARRRAPGPRSAAVGSAGHRAECTRCHTAGNLAATHAPSYPAAGGRTLRCLRGRRRRARPVPPGRLHPLPRARVAPRPARRARRRRVAHRCARRRHRRHRRARAGRPRRGRRVRDHAAARRPDRPARARDRRGRRRVGRGVAAGRPLPRPAARLPAPRRGPARGARPRHARDATRRRDRRASSPPTGRRSCGATAVLVAAGEPHPAAGGARGPRGRHGRVAARRERRRPAPTISRSRRCRRAARRSSPAAKVIRSAPSNAGSCSSLARIADRLPALDARCPAHGAWPRPNCGRATGYGGPHWRPVHSARRSAAGSREQWAAFVAHRARGCAERSHVHVVRAWRELDAVRARYLSPPAPMPSSSRPFETMSTAAAIYANTAGLR